jgi:hypothetical protein
MNRSKVRAVFLERTDIRRVIAPTMLLVVIVLAGVMQRDVGKADWLALARWLNRYELFHILAHLVIFGSIALLLGPWDRRGSRVRVWRYTLIGGLLLEVVQYGAGDASLSRSVILAALFDLGVDILGARFGLAALARREQSSRLRRPTAS